MTRPLLPSLTVWCGVRVTTLWGSARRGMCWWCCIGDVGVVVEEGEEENSKVSQYDSQFRIPGQIRPDHGLKVPELKGGRVLGEFKRLPIRLAFAGFQDRYVPFTAWEYTNASTQRRLSILHPFPSFLFPQESVSTAILPTRCRKCHTPFPGESRERTRLIPGFTPMGWKAATG
ncbi:hypothetical protein BDQ17DRAFT_1326837 [Cyathus striatus]|nr:hypothetical protein BDQ17DRAFT_1326837 [Cyathus striatus]